MVLRFNKFFIFLCLAIAGEAHAYRPLEESLFRNNGNPLLSKEGVNMLVKIYDVDEPTRPYLVKFVLSRLDNRKMYQQIFYGQDFRSTEVLHFTKSIDFSFKSLNKSKNHLAILYYCLLDMYMANSSDFMMDYFQNLSIPLERTAKQINKGQESLVNAYIAFARRKMRNPKISDSESPLAVPGKTSQLLFESFYEPDAKKAKLDRRDGSFVWVVKHDGLEAVFEHSARFMKEINLTDLDVSAKTEGKQTFGGSYLLPKTIFLFDSGVKRFQVDIITYENFKDSKRQYIQRADDYIKYAKKTPGQSAVSEFPAFLLR